jgi:hypothetical protein
MQLFSLKHIITFIVSSLFIYTATNAQEFDNPSFEGEPQDARVPEGWFPCQPGTTPDILPGPWGVYNDAENGETFLGLITRQDGTWESIGQRLLMPLERNECYFFFISLAKSDTYTGYTGNARLRIWGSNEKCGFDHLIYDSGTVKNVDWKKHKVNFSTESSIRYISFEVYYLEGSQTAYKGNILLDNLSPIYKCPRV